MQGSNDDDSQKHSKIEYLKYFRRRKGQNSNAKKLCQCYSRHDGTGDVGQPIFGFVHARLARRQNDGTCDVRTKFYGDTNTLKTQTV